MDLGESDDSDFGEDDSMGGGDAEVAELWWETDADDDQRLKSELASAEQDLESSMQCSDSGQPSHAELVRSIEWQEAF